ncbi:MAG TPA: RcpC/CpaB family pilus assembly protein [Acidimicrobiia bacterium]|jgi:Flp pilus assembly protein CpaB
MLGAGLAALLANLAFLRQADSSVQVAVASRPLTAGTAVSAADFSAVALNADATILDGLIRWDQRTSTTGMVTARSISAGDLVSHSDLLTAAAPNGLKAMSIPIEPAHAAGGQIIPGDRVDVIGVQDGIASFLVTDAEVLQISAGSSGGLGGVGSSYLVVAVDNASSLRLAEAIAAGTVEVIRSTGSNSEGASG